jgi:hypothetical protein
MAPAAADVQSALFPDPPKSLKTADGLAYMRSSEQASFTLVPVTDNFGQNCRIRRSLRNFTG